MRKYKVVLLALGMAALVAAQSVVASATSISDLKSRKEEIDAQTKKAKDILADTTEEKSAVLAEVLQLDTQLDEAESELQMITDELDRINARLEEAGQELAEAEAKREAQYETLKQRIRYMYENGEVGYLDVIFEATDFSDFITRFEYVNRIIEYDDHMVSELLATEQTIADRVSEIETKKSEQEILADKQTEKKNQLEIAISEKNVLIENLRHNEETYMQQVADLEASSAEVSAMIKKAEAKAKADAEAKARAQSGASARSGVSSGPIIYNGKMNWPVVGRSNISSPFGYRDSPISGKRELHTGIDIPAPTGTSILAAESGTVISAKYMNGYGYTVIIDHGGGISTLYGHNSSLLVSAGDHVERGQNIAKAGSTGYSTGPHCHFEVRENGTPVNPLNGYVVQP